MSTSGNQPLSGAIFEESELLSVAELSRICAVDERHIVELVDEGVVSVVEIGTTEWRFSGTALRRIRLALRLERDLELNLAGVALALDLMEEVERLRRALRGRS
jgi:chaperone modulatory protein CbpM